MDNQHIIDKKFLYSKAINKVKSKQNIAKVFISFLVILLIVLIVIQPSLCISSVYNGLSVWAKTVLPSLFPFVFLTKLLSNLNVLETITDKLSKVTKFLFKAPAISSYIFLMSIISGYPVGAKLISEFYQQGKITDRQANKLVTFCSTSGPLFIIGSVGTAIFFDKKIGYILFFSHILSSIINGIVFRNKFVDKTEMQKNAKNECELSTILPNTMNDTILSCLVVGGYIAIFFLMIELFNNFGFFNPIVDFLSNILSSLGVTKNAIKSTIFGIIEISKGCIEIAKSGISIIASTTIASFLISFGGLCTFFQATTFLSKCKVDLKFYLFQKLTHAIISAMLSFVLMHVFFWK